MSSGFGRSLWKSTGFLLILVVTLAFVADLRAVENKENAGSGRVPDGSLTVVCPPNITVDCPTNICPDHTGRPAVSGAVGPIDTSFVNIGLKCGCLFDFTRLWIAVDSQGRCDTCLQVITVHDDVPPVLNCPDDMVFECDEIGNFGHATATDNCDPRPVIRYSDEKIDGRCPWEFTIVRTWRAHDHCGNLTTCEQKITIEDSKPPVIICCPRDTVVTPGFNIERLGDAIATDNCNRSPEMRYEAATFPGQSECDYRIVRSWEFTDGCCNIAACQQRVRVRCEPDLAVQARNHDERREYEESDQSRLVPELAEPVAISLGSHPNPLSGSTTITYALPASGVAAVEVFDIQGRRVTTLAEGYHEAGYYKVMWDGNDSENRAAVPGVYFCRLTCNERPAILEKLVKF
jgi:hypothetical protein